MPAIKVAVCAAKGGVGKTTTATELCGQTANMGKKALFIDLDAQADGTNLLLGKRLGKDEKSIFDLIVSESEKYSEKIEISEVIRKTNFENIHLLPAHLNLEDIGEKIGKDSFWVSYLDNIVSKLDDYYNLIVIDSKPESTFLNRMSMKSANKLVIPTDTSPNGENGVSVVVAMANLFKKKLNHNLDSISILITSQHKTNSKSFSDAVKSLKSEFPKFFIDVSIPHTTNYLDGIRQTTPQLAAYHLKQNHKMNIGYKFFTNHILKP